MGQLMVVGSYCTQGRHHGVKRYRPISTVNGSVVPPRAEPWNMYCANKKEACSGCFRYGPIDGCGVGGAEVFCCGDDILVRRLKGVAVLFDGAAEFDSMKLPKSVDVCRSG